MSRTKREYNYVAHDCRNTRNGTCNNRFIAEDYTGATMKCPAWRYCPECCKKLGIDYDKQKPSDYRSEEELEKIKERVTKMRSKLNQNIQ